MAQAIYPCMLYIIRGLMTLGIPKEAKCPLVPQHTRTHTPSSVGAFHTSPHARPGGTEGPFFPALYPPLQPASHGVPFPELSPGKKKTLHVRRASVARCGAWLLLASKKATKFPGPAPGDLLGGGGGEKSPGAPNSPSRAKGEASAPS